MQRKEWRRRFDPQPDPTPDEIEVAAKRLRAEHLREMAAKPRPQVRPASKLAETGPVVAAGDLDEDEPI